MTWQPQKDGLEQICKLLQDSTSPNNALQRQVQQQLDSFNKIPEYNNYLALIFCSQELDPSVRAISGLTLKNNIRSYYDTMQPVVIDYIKHLVMNSIGDQNELIRTTGGNIITTMISKDLKRFSDILIQLVQLIDHPDFKVVRGAIGALQKVCEDSSRELAQLDPEFVKSCLPKFIILFSHQDSRIRVGGVNCFNQFIMIQCEPAYLFLNEYLNALYRLTNDTDQYVRKAVCQAFVMVLEVKPDAIIQQISNIVDFMLFCTQSDDESVALEACEFWLTFADQDSLKDYLHPFLPKLLPVLLKSMIYSEDDILFMDAEEENINAPDNLQDIKPRHHKVKAHETQSKDDKPKPTEDLDNFDYEDEDDYDEDDEDDDDVYGEWNLRKCAASALDRISTIYQIEILPLVLPYLKQELFHESWEHRECGILALGAIAEGCMEGMIQHLPTLIPMLFNSLNDQKFMVRSIACWTLGRYIDWIVFAPGVPNLTAHHATYMNPFLEHILRLVLDNHKKVQEAACSSLSILEENARNYLEPFIQHILQTIVAAFSKYQAKNLMMLYDSVATLAEAVGPALNQKAYIDIIMPPLIEKWSTLKDDDRDLFPLFECLSAISISLGPGFQPFAAHVWERCVRLIQTTLQHIQFHMTHPETDEPDKDFLIIALDLLSGIIQGLGSASESLIFGSSPNLMQILDICSKDPVNDVKQSTFALYGDISIQVYPAMKPYISSIMNELITNIHVDCPINAVSVCNNAVWAAGEISMQEPEIPLFIIPLFQRCVGIISKENARNLKENAAITIGRLGILHSHQVASYLDVFLQPWCTIMVGISETQEKESAFLGLLKMIEVNPQGITTHFGHFCHLIVTWNNISPPLNNHIANLLVGFKSLMGEQWGVYLNTFPAELRDALLKKYGL